MTEERIDIDTDVACRQVTTLEEPQYGYDTTCLDGSEIPVMTADHLSDKGPVNFALLVACFTVSCTGIIAGFDNVVISPIAGLPAFVLKYQGLNPVTQTYALTASNQSLLFAVPYVGAVCGCIATPFANNYFGRKWTLVAAYIISIGAGFLQLFAPNFAAFVIGRLINLLGVGILTATAPLYLSEIVPASLRGAAVSPINILGGISAVLATVTVYESDKRSGSLSYQIPLAVQCVLPAALFLLTLFLPESPQWLVSKYCMNQARKNLRNLRAWSDAQIDDELRVMRLIELSEHSLAEGTQFWQIFNRNNIKRTVFAAAFTSCSVSVSGSLISTTYITVFFIQLGLGSAYTVTVVATSMILAGGIAAPFVVYRFGRRTIAFGGFALLIVIDMIAGGLAFSTSKGALLGIVALSCILNFIYYAVYSPLALIIPSEIAAPKLRTHTMSYAIIWVYLAEVIANFALPRLTDPGAADLGAKTYLIFCGLMFCNLVMIYWFLPESAGRSFGEIDEMYRAKVPMRKWRRYKTTTIAIAAVEGKPVQVVNV